LSSLQNKVVALFLGIPYFIGLDWTLISIKAFVNSFLSF